METENHNKGTKIRVVEYKDRITVTSYNDQRLPNNTILWSDEAEGVRNYFQKKQDMELGRWRDPVDPDMVCYPLDDRTLVDVRVLDERKGTTCYFDRNDTNLRLFGKSFETTIRYFEAHPVKKKKPWADAAQGDIWVLTSPDGKAIPYTKSREKWVREHVIVALTDDFFVDGYQLWPES